MLAFPYSKGNDWRSKIRQAIEKYPYKVPVCLGSPKTVLQNWKATNKCWLVGDPYLCSHHFQERVHWFEKGFFYVKVCPNVLSEEILFPALLSFNFQLKFKKKSNLFKSVRITFQVISYICSWEPSFLLSPSFLFASN